MSIIFGGRTRRPEALSDNIAITASSVCFAYDTQMQELPLQIPALSSAGYLYRTTDIVHIDQRTQSRKSYGFIRMPRKHFVHPALWPGRIDTNVELIYRANALQEVYLKSDILGPQDFIQDIFPYSDPVTRYTYEYTATNYRSTPNAEIISFGNDLIYMSGVELAKPNRKLLDHLETIIEHFPLATIIREGSVLYAFFMHTDFSAMDIRSAFRGYEVTHLVHSRIADCYALSCPLHTEDKEDY